MGTLVDFARELRDRISIVDVVGSYVPLKRTGANWKGLCPFHREKTPSFIVSQTKNTFHCFGCHVGGDAIRFVELVEHVEWKDAVRILAEKYGIPMPEFRHSSHSGAADVRKTLYEINKLASDHFASNLAAALARKDDPAKEYLARRNLDPQTIDKFRLGLAVDEWTRLTDEIRRAGYDPSHAVAAGVALQHADSGRIYDRFRGRLIFPICDNVGRPVAFGARVYLPNASPDQPKYINSPETELYRKGQYLYGYHLAKEAIAREGVAILVEGYMDTIRAHQHGFTNTVASCGTALTSDQARLLRRLCDKVVFVYDGDEAGQKAMLRGCDVLLEQEFAISIVVLPDDHDPDSFLLAFGAEEFRKHLDGAVDFYEFFLKRALAQFGSQDVPSKVQAFRFLLPILRKVPSEIARDAYLKQTARELGVDLAALRREFAKNAPGRELLGSSVEIAPPTPGVPLVERYLLKLCVEQERLQFTILEHLQPEWLTSELARKWYIVCRDRLMDGLPLDWQTLYEMCDGPDGEDARFLRAVALEDSEPAETVEELAVRNVAARLERAWLDREHRQLVEMCERLYPQDPEGEHWQPYVEQIRAKLGHFCEVTRALRPDRAIWRNAGPTSS
jgi:DNA primase